MQPKAIVAIVAFLALNLPVLAVLISLRWIADLKQALKEKDPAAGGADMTSYSRVTGLIGAIVVTSFFWAIGNVILYDAFVSVASIGAIMSGALRFFLIGSALFLPYAFNQLRAMVGSLGPAAATAAAGPQSPGATLVSSGFDGPTPSQVVIANLSQSIDDARLAPVVAAIAAQVSGEFFKAWGKTATFSTVRLSPAGGMAPIDSAADAVIYLGDQAADPNSGVQVVYGYHRNNHGGLPYGFVYLDVCDAYGIAWSSILSHEVLELLADPYLNTEKLAPAPAGSPYAGQMASYGVEVCDPVMGDTYPVNAVAVSNFVTPTYFTPGSDPKTTNQLGRPLAPFSVTPTGYLQYKVDGVPDVIDGDNLGAAQIAARALMRGWRRNARRAAQLAPAVNAAEHSPRKRATAP